MEWTQAKLQEESEEGVAEMVLHCDSLGFIAPAPGTIEAGQYNAERRYKAVFLEKGQRRMRRFEGNRAKLPGPAELHWALLPPKQLKAMLRKGVPPQYRKEVWWSILGCAAAKARSTKSYAQLRDAPIDSKVAEEIERDLARSYPGHQKFHGVDSAASRNAGQQQLREVLHAFAVQWANVKYCQGLNFIGGLLLIVFDDAEMAFWALHCAMEKLEIDGYYLEGMALLRGDMRVLEKLLSQKCPAVARILREAGVDLISICSEWFITWYAKSLPHATTLRVWDALFYEGFKVLFRVAVAIFKRAEADVVKCGGDFEILMQQGKQWAHQQVEHNELLKCSFSLEPLRRSDLLAQRKLAMEQIKEEDERHRLRIAAHQKDVPQQH
mmetsp:Transcript_76040/g.180983  ORF Transcript_76040/g.180983 Transcript_76040/m.180983 type:complete len:382 (-) Transcript_76040:104-1249(-)